MTVSEPRLPEGTPWVETREGGWFFVNALLVAPAFMVAFPWTLRWLLGMAGVASGPNRLLDTIPTMAAFIVPYVGWLAVLPLATTIHALRLVGPRPGPLGSSRVLARPRGRPGLYDLVVGLQPDLPRGGAVREHHLEVTRTARYHTLGEAGAATEQVWFVCHGYRQLAARFLIRFRGLDERHEADRGSGGTVALLRGSDAPPPRTGASRGGRVDDPGRSVVRDRRLRRVPGSAGGRRLAHRGRAPFRIRERTVRPDRPRLLSGGAHGVPMGGRGRRKTRKAHPLGRLPSPGPRHGAGGPCPERRPV